MPCLFVYFVCTRSVWCVSEWVCLSCCCCYCWRTSCWAKPNSETTRAHVAANNMTNMTIRAVATGMSKFVYLPPACDMCKNIQMPLQAFFPLCCVDCCFFVLWSVKTLFCTWRRRRSKCPQHASAQGDHITTSNKPLLFGDARRLFKGLLSSNQEFSIYIHSMRSGQFVRGAEEYLFVCRPHAEWDLWGKSLRMGWMGIRGKIEILLF